METRNESKHVRRPHRRSKNIGPRLCVCVCVCVRDGGGGGGGLNQLPDALLYTDRKKNKHMLSFLAEKGCWKRMDFENQSMDGCVLKPSSALRS